MIIKPTSEELGEVFAFRLQKMMEARGWPIEYVAAKSGVSERRIKIWLEKKINPCLDNWIKIRDVFGCSFDCLLGLSDK